MEMSFLPPLTLILPLVCLACCNKNIDLVAIKHKFIFLEFRSCVIEDSRCCRFHVWGEIISWFIASCLSPHPHKVEEARSLPGLFMSTETVLLLSRPCLKGPASFHHTRAYPACRSGQWAVVALSSLWHHPILSSRSVGMLHLVCYKQQI